MLTFRELSSATRFAQADFLALYFTCIACYETGSTQILAKFAIIFHQCAGNAMTNSAGLTRDSTTAYLDVDVELVIHFNNIERLAEEGKLLVAGPFYGIDRVPGSWRGLFVFNTADTAEARSWVHSDPAVQAGVFRVVLAPWYSSGALQAVNAIHGELDVKSHAD